MDGFSFDRRQEPLGVLGVIGEDVRAELDFSARFADALAHFESHDLGEFVGLGMKDFGRLGDDRRAFGKALLFPVLETFRGCCELGLQLCIGQFIEVFHELAGGGIDALVGHVLVLSVRRTETGEGGRDRRFRASAQIDHSRHASCENDAFDGDDYSALTRNEFRQQRS